MLHVIGVEDFQELDNVKPRQITIRPVMTMRKENTTEVILVNEKKKDDPAIVPTQIIEVEVGEGEEEEKSEQLTAFFKCDEDKEGWDLQAWLDEQTIAEAAWKDMFKARSPDNKRFNPCS